MPEQDAKEVATEGQDRPGDYIVRKGHFVLVENTIGAVVPSPHRLAWRRLTIEKVVFLVRDPRDICVSGAWHWNKSTGQKAVNNFLERMIKGDVAKCGRWDEYVSRWMNITMAYEDIAYPVMYEDLVTDPYNDLRNIIAYIGCEYDINRTHAAIERNSFEARAKGKNDKELRRNNMRKGVAGDWRNHFTPEMRDKIWQEFGWMMERLGYEK